MEKGCALEVARLFLPEGEGKSHFPSRIHVPPPDHPQTIKNLSLKCEKHAEGQEPSSPKTPEAIQENRGKKTVKTRSCSGRLLS